MPGGYPCPFGKVGEDAAHTANQPDPNGAAAPVVVPRQQPADGRAMAALAPGPRHLEMGGHAAAEALRRAKGEQPHSDDEVIQSYWNRNNPAKIPQVGERVKYVRFPWTQWEWATVLSVQPLTDDDPNLNGIVRDLHGNSYLCASDPAPYVVLQSDSGLVASCREARVRGSAGWHR